VLTVAASAFLLVTTEFLPIGLLSSIAASLETTSGIAGLAVTIPGAIAAVSAPLMTLLAGRLDRRTVLQGLTGLMIVSCLVAALAPNLLAFLVGRVLLGIAVGGFWTFALSAGRRLVASADGGKAVALISAGISVGTILGVPAGALIGQSAGWRQAFYTTAGLGVVVLIPLIALLPSLPVHQSINLRQLTTIIRNRDVRTGLVAAMFVFVGHFAAYTYFEPFLRMVVRAEATVVTGALVAYGVAGIAGTLLAERAIRSGLRRTFIGTTALLGASVLGAPLAGQSTPAAFMLIALWGLAFGAVPICLQIWMYHAAPNAYEASSAWIVTTCQFALALGAFLGGRLVDMSGVPSAFVLAGISTFLACAYVAAFGLERKAKSKAHAEEC
jgi:predicted MFS family arabinose efflux permease